MSETLRPRLSLLAAPEADRIVEQALAVLDSVGILVENDEARDRLAGAGGRVEGDRVQLPESAVRRALESAPDRVLVYDRDGELALDLGGDRVHFDPGSTAVQILDRETGRHRDPSIVDCEQLAWVTEACQHISAQSTALVPADVPVELADRIRLFVALRHGRKPVITGTFRVDAFDFMKQLLVLVRGGEDELREKPLAIFDCCPTPPLAWSHLTSRALMDCAAAGIPATLISMPLGGATAPVTLREMVVQHCAESLSGLVLHQSVSAGAPIIWGGAAAAFDMRHGTTPAGSVESAMVNLADAQVGRSLGLPTHGYLGLSDSKVADWQAGAETAKGLMLAALAGVNLVAGPGILSFIGCQSLEKLLLDNEACGQAHRLVRGVGLDSAELAPELLEAVVETGHFLGHRHTRRNFRRELHFPGPLVDRRPYQEWSDDGAHDAFRRAAIEVDRILAAGNPAPLPEPLESELRRCMQAETARLGHPDLEMT